MSASASSVTNVLRFLCASASEAAVVGFVRPACGFQLTPCSTDVEIGNGDNVHALREARLREKHRSEFAGADHGDRHRSAGRLTLKKFRMEIQGTLVANATET